MRAPRTSRVLLVATWAAGALLAPAAGAQDEPSPAPPVRGVAILPPQNPSGGEAIDWLATGMAELLPADLDAQGTLTVISATQVRRRVRSDSVPTGQKELAQLARDIGASALITGSFGPVDEKGRVELTMSLVSGLSGRSAATVKGEVPLAQPLPEVRRILARVLVEAGFSGVDEAALLRRPSPTRDTLILLHRSRELRSSDPDVARARFRTAVVTDPVVALLFEDLANAFPRERPRATVVAAPPGGGVEAWVPQAVSLALNADLPLLGLEVIEPRGTVVQGAELNEATAGAVAQTVGVDMGLLVEVSRRETALVVTLSAVSTAGRTLFSVERSEESGDPMKAAESVERALIDVLRLEATPSVWGRLLVRRQTADEVKARLAAQAQPGVTGPAPPLGLPVIERFEAVPGGAGQSATVLAWEATGVEKCAISDLGEVGVTGRRMVAPDVPTEYVLRCTQGDQAVEASAHVGVVSGVPWTAIGFWTALGVATGGGALALAGFTFSTFPAALSNQLHGMQLVVVNEEDNQQLRDQRDQLALLANTSVMVGALGIAIAGAGLAAVAVIKVAEE